MGILGGLLPIQRYVAIGLAASLAVSVLANGALTKAWLGARDDVAAAVASCNADKERSIAEAEKIARTAAEKAAAAKLAQLQAQIDAEAAATAQERAKRAEAEAVIAERDNELQRLAEEAFDEDDLPDSNAALNVYLTSHALRCVLHSRNQGEAGAGPGGDDGVCANPGSPDGVHPGFSNVTYGDALRFWGADRDAAIRLNERMAEIRRIQGEVVDDGD